MSTRHEVSSVHPDCTHIVVFRDGHVYAAGTFEDCNVAMSNLYRLHQNDTGLVPVFGDYWISSRPMSGRWTDWTDTRPR